MGTGSNGELKYEISQNAYIKLVLHSLRHKTAAVNGVLVGRISPKDDGVVEISDSVPLFHSNLALLPPLEISLIMVGLSSSDSYIPFLPIRIGLIHEL